MNDSMIRDISLAEEGLQRIRWVGKFMPALNALKRDFINNQALKGKTIVMSIHLEAKTAYLALTLQSAGADVIVTGSNPLSTQDPIAAGLVNQGITVYAWHGCTDEEYTMFLNKALDHMPHIIIDDGGDLVHLLHSNRTDAKKNLIGGSEETTTGIYRLKALEKENKLAFPMIAVNDSYCKYLFDNRYGTGQSVWDGVIRSTNLTVTGKTVVVAGYGWCGKGVSMRAKGMGARVIVTEVDPVRAIEAVMDGFTVMPMDEAAKLGDLFITVTGCCDVIRAEHFDVMRDGALLANSGHFDVEIDKHALEAKADKVWQRKPNIMGYRMKDGRILNLLAEGRLVNLAAGNGHPAEIMDMSFALQAKCLEYVVRHADELENKVYQVPAEIDSEVARLKLSGMGACIDTLSDSQKEYLAE